MLPPTRYAGVFYFLDTVPCTTTLIASDFLQRNRTHMKQHHMVALIALGAFIALTNTVNTMLISVLNPVLSAVKGSYA